MKDIYERDKGKYIEECEMQIQGAKVIAIEETVIGNNYEILSFSREYHPPLEYIPKPGTYVNKYSTKMKKEEVNIIETTIIDENFKVISFKKTIT